MAVPAPAEGPEPELRRRRLLAGSDRILERVEGLRLTDRRRVPPSLAAAIRSLQLMLGQLEEATRPRTPRAAQQLVFGLQERLMAANPRHARARPHLGRPAGTSRLARLARGGEWRFLALPPVSGEQPDAAWRDRVRLTLERALDRWCYAQGRAVRAARARRPEARREWERAQAAWANYWDLRREAEALLGADRPPGPE